MQIVAEDEIDNKRVDIVVDKFIVEEGVEVSESIRLEVFDKPIF